MLKYSQIIKDIILLFKKAGWIDWRNLRAATLRNGCSINCFLTISQKMMNPIMMATIEPYILTKGL